GSIDHSGAAVVTVATQSTGINTTTGQPLAAGESTTPIGGVTDPAGDALFKPIGGTNVPGADITDTQLTLDGGTLHVKITIAGDSLSKAADATGRTAADAVVRWQMGDVLYYAAVEELTQGGAPTYFAGATQSIDLC